MLFTFLLVVHALIAAALVGVILMQRSEGGGLGMGSGPSGLMTARGAADFLTRATTVLAVLFVLMAFLLAGIASFGGRNSGAIDTSLAHQAAPAPITAPSSSPTANIPMIGAAPIPATPAGATPQAGAPGIVPSVGQPAPPPPAEQKAAEKAVAARRAAAISSLKPIQTKPARATVGIGGVTGEGAGTGAADRKAATPTFSIAPPAGNAAATVPTLSVPAPASNSAQPK